MKLQEYKRRVDTPTTAVRVQLKLKGGSFEFEKWGGVQSCKEGDWIVCYEGEAHVVDADVFARTYRELTPGAFEKITSVWAAAANEDGKIETKEGATAYRAGDFLVFNNPKGLDGYAMNARKFRSTYRPI